MKKKLIVSILTISVITIGGLTACGTKDSEATSGNEASVKDSGKGDYFYGTLNLSYADYYYGELNNVEPEEPKNSKEGKYDAENLVEKSGFTGEGMYDAVTSATTTKAKLFESTITEDTTSGVNIVGPSKVNVAISKDLYEDVQKAIKKGTKCNNELIDLVKNLGNVSEKAPSEYKVINSDGILSKTIGNTTKVENIEAVMSTSSVWGNYDIMLNGLEVDISQVQGGIIETSDGAKYGLQHLDNLWLQPQEIAFSVKEFTDPHENVAGYKRFEDMEGKTITKITYLVANGDDIEVDVSLFCKLQLSDEYKAEIKESSYSSAGTKIPVTLTVPDDSNYTLSNVIKGRTSIEKGLYEFKDGTIVLTADCKPGEYEFVFTDEKYADIVISTKIESGLLDGDVSAEGSKLVVKTNSNGLTIKDYIEGITTVSINGKPLDGMNLGTAIFHEDGSVNMDAKLKSREDETAVFEGSDSYELTIEASGYPSVKMTVTP